MAKTALVEDNIIDGRYLIEALADAGFHISVAFWWFRPDPPAWELILSSPLLSKGPMESYHFVQAALRKLNNEVLLATPFDYVIPFSIELTDISAIRPDDNVVLIMAKVMTESLGTSESIPRDPLPPRNTMMKLGWPRISVPGVRLTQSVVDGVYIDDAFIYSGLSENEAHNGTPRPLKAKVNYGDMTGTVAADHHDQKNISDLAKGRGVNTEQYFIFGVKVSFDKENRHDLGAKLQIDLLGVDIRIVGMGIDSIRDYMSRNGGKLPYISFQTSITFEELLMAFKRFDLVLTSNLGSISTAIEQERIVLDKKV